MTIFDVNLDDRDNVNTHNVVYVRFMALKIFLWVHFSHVNNWMHI